VLQCGRLRRGERFAHDLPGPDGELERIPDIYRTTFEPLETLSHVAALTSRIALGTNIVNPLFHAPVVLARRYATLDQFSGGRAIAGFGQGWIPQEFATAGVPMKRRGLRRRHRGDPGLLGT
jgi:alkanesulfonate monooxygenase SsuD/methylene tetrahydromethanopterin reductase-like flavin-dependent oxidoreductase (luciferase family)